MEERGMNARIKALRKKGIHDWLIGDAVRLGGGKVEFRRTPEALEIDGAEVRGDFPVCYRFSVS